MVAGNYLPGDVVAFHRDYKSLGVSKGDERHVARVDHRMGTVMLEGPEGQSVPWRPRAGGREARRGRGLPDGDRWSCAPATASGGPATTPASGWSTATRRKSLRFGAAVSPSGSATGGCWNSAGTTPRLRHLDHAWASTVHAFQGRTVDNVIAVMEAKHPKLSTQKSFYVEISRARHSAELVTDDVKELRETLEAATGERISALEGIGASEKALAEEKARGGEKERGRGLEALLERPAGTRDEAQGKGREVQPEPEKAQEPKQKSVEMDLGL